MKTTKRRTIFHAFNLITIMLFAVFFVAPALAHGGEDHGDEKPKTVSNEKGTITRTVRVGEFEIMLKHAPLEPDAESSAKLFVTRYGTNEAVGDAKVAVEVTARDGRTYEASAVKSDAAGSYGFKLPSLPEGGYTILARINTAGETDTATFSGVEIQYAHADAAESESSRMQNTLMALTAAIILALFSGLIYFAARVGRNETTREKAVSV